MVDMRRVPGGAQPLGQRLRIGGIALLVFAAVLIVGSTYYTVGPDEEAVVTRFGRFVRVEGPGLHFKLPIVESAESVKVLRVEREEFGYRTVDASAARTRYERAEHEHESLMLTGDLNQVDVEWAVQFKIKDAKDYLFSVRDPRRTLRAITESVMRAEIGDRSGYEVLTIGTRQIETDAEQRLQKILDLYVVGIQIERIELQNALPPEPVRPSFTDVEAAKQERETTINRARQGYNQVIPSAQGRATQLISAAEGYEIDRVNRARGEADRFTRVLTEYQKAPAVTRQRLYLEVLGEILPKVRRKVIIDDDVTGVLPMLELLPGAGGDR